MFSLSNKKSTASAAPVVVCDTLPYRAKSSAQTACHSAQNSCHSERSEESAALPLLPAQPAEGGCPIHRVFCDEWDIVATRRPPLPLLLLALAVVCSCSEVGAGFSPHLQSRHKTGL
jgi:hypothetical protein